MMIQFYVDCEEVGLVGGSLEFGFRAKVCRTRILTMCFKVAEDVSGRWFGHNLTVSEAWN
jgi:hypothetical protein